MSKVKNKKLFSTFALMTSLSLIITITPHTVKAKPSVDELYKVAFNATMQVKGIAEKNGVNPYFTSGKASETSSVLKAVQAGLQRDINNSRNAQNSLLKNYPSYINYARTFSSIVDNYQHPVYERAVSEIESLKTKNYKQSDINTIKQLIEDIPFTFKSGYSSTLDIYQGKYITLAKEAVDKAVISKNKNDITAAYGLVNDLATVLLNDNVKDYANDLLDKLNTVGINVTSATVSDSKTIELKGEWLNNLKASYISIPNNYVELITPGSGGSSAKLSLENDLPPNQNVTITFKIEDKSFQISSTFLYDVKKASLNKDSFTAFKRGQTITFKVNSEKNNASISYLNSAGYSVRFTATDKKNVLTPIFQGGDWYSSTGILDDNIYEGDFNILLEISKDSKVVASSKQAIKVSKNSSGGENPAEDYNNISSVSVNKETFEYRKSGQRITFRVNNGSSNANIDALIKAGYTLKFTATDKDNKETVPIFENNTAVSPTGILKSQLDTGIYTIQVQISKSNKTISSPKQTIEVTDIVSNLSSITNVTLKNENNSGFFTMNSSTLVLGERASVSNIEGSVKNISGVASVPLEYVEVTSSNDNILIQQNPTSIKLVTNKIGSTVITFKCGNVKKNIYLTITNSLRKVNRIIPSSNSIKVAEGVETKLNLVALDQYGDPIAVAGKKDYATSTNNIVSIEMQNNDIASTDEFKTSFLDGKFTGFGITGKAIGRTTLYFRNSNITIGAIDIEVAANTSGVTYKPQITYDSIEQKNIFPVGSSITYEYAKFNNNGVYIGSAPISDSDKVEKGIFKIEPSKGDIASVSVTPVKNSFTIVGVKEGSCEILIKDNNAIVARIPITITKVASNDVKLTGISLLGNNTTIDYADKTITIFDALDVRSDEYKHKLVYGVTHNQPTIYPVRITPNGILYIDEKNKGFYANETHLGRVIVEKSSGSNSFDLFNGIKTSRGDKYTITFKILSDKNSDGKIDTNEVFSSTVINVNVPK